MPPIFSRSLVLAAVVVAGVTALAQIAIRPGQYAQTIEMQLSDAPAPVVQKDVDCITPQEAKDVVKAMMNQASQGMDLDQSCKPSFKTAGNRVLVTGACDVEGARGTFTMEMEFGPDWYNTSMRMTYGTRTTTMRASAKWVGSTCKEEN